MSMHHILETVREFEGILELAPGEGSGFPEIAWGDHFFYYSPDGRIPQHHQPFATIVTKDYPGEPSSNLGSVDRYRVNVDVGRSTFTELTGETPRDFNSSDKKSREFGESDVFMPHPGYGARGWVAVVNPAERTMTPLVDLLHAAYEKQRRHVERRAREGDHNDSTAPEQ
ncbi:DUF6194 family protein [Actinopolyspora sp. H202]|uniref:DUF6194 family protein n=1 Tax=Actinopolyspora sp. H202 TaxID=1500456 RepID=UPI003EE59459